MPTTVTIWDIRSDCLITFRFFKNLHIFHKPIANRHETHQMILMSIYSVPMYLGSDRLEFLRGGVQWMMFQVMKGKKERKSLNH